jgi:hypothetical protein
MGNESELRQTTGYVKPKADESQLSSRAERIFFMFLRPYFVLFAVKASHRFLTTIEILRLRKTVRTSPSRCAQDDKLNVVSLAPDGFPQLIIYTDLFL